MEKKIGKSDDHKENDSHDDPMESELFQTGKSGGYGCFWLSQTTGKAIPKQQVVKVGYRLQVGVNLNILSLCMSAWRMKATLSGKKISMKLY